MSPPWMPLYVADYLADTGHLDAAEHGAYLLLIMHYWRAGGLPDDEKQLARIAKMTPAEWRRSRDTLRAFFHDGWQHGRIDEELANAQAKQERRQEAGKRGGIAKANAKQNPSNASPLPEPDDSNALASSSQPESERKEDTADAVSPPKVYAFESGLIRLNQRDLDRWKSAFCNIDVCAELIGLTEWAEKQGPQRWFNAVSGALAKRNREAKEARDRAQTFKWNSGIEGVI